MRQNPLLMTDGYKSSHHLLYPPGTTLVYSNFTPRNTEYMPKQAKGIVVFGLQYTMKYIKDLYDKDFFDRPKEEVCGEAKKVLSAYLGSEYDVTHFEKLHDLGYLPINVKGLPEGSVVGVRVPIMTIYNTHPDFFWLTNFLETLISSLLWKPLHSASLAFGYKKILLNAAKETDSKNVGFVDFQGHDFSFRGMQHPESAISSDLGFLTSFKGTDTVPALLAAKYYYAEPSAGFSVPASEHSVVTAYGKEDEIGCFERVMDVFPTGILSMVSDSFDLWKVVGKGGVCDKLKDKILAREGKLVIRPDSGDPVDIICGRYCNRAAEKLAGMGDTSTFEAYQKAYDGQCEFKSEESFKGVIECLWDIFGGTINEQGYKILDSHIGCIYGDSITLERAEQITQRLKAKGFASTNVVLGIGSFSMGYATRDQQGSAVKSTYVEVDGKGREIFKDPVTDSGTKKSAKGLVAVYREAAGNSVYLVDQVSWKEEGNSELKPVFLDGKMMNQKTLGEIRTKLETYL